MRNVLMVFACALVVTLGAISLVNSYSPAQAGPLGDNTTDDDDALNDCHDDGDDGENPGVADDPDQEDNQEIVPGGEQHDAEDEDPGTEADDPVNCRAILPDTASPSPTPCPSIVTVAGGASECCPTFNQGLEFHCVCPDSAGGEVGAEGTCYCTEGGQPNGCLCQDATAPDCCSTYGQFCGSTVKSADVNCDGSVTVTDAYESLIVLSGFEPSSGDGCGGGSPGDADCSNGVDAKDTLAILTVVAGLKDAAAC